MSEYPDYLIAVSDFIDPDTMPLISDIDTALHSLGYDVIAEDLPTRIDSLIEPTISQVRAEVIEVYTEAVYKVLQLNGIILDTNSNIPVYVLAKLIQGVTLVLLKQLPLEVLESIDSDYGTVETLAYVITKLTGLDDYQFLIYLISVDSSILELFALPTTDTGTVILDPSIIARLHLNFPNGVPEVVASYIRSGNVVLDLNNLPAVLLREISQLTTIDKLYNEVFALMVMAEPNSDYILIGQQIVDELDIEVSLRLKLLTRILNTTVG